MRSTSMVKYAYLPDMPGRVKNREVTEYYIRLVLKELGLHKLRTRPITIGFRKNVEGCLGLCSGDTTYANIDVATHCPVEGRKLTYLEMMRTMTHELVHARQFLRGQLSAEGKWMWKGRNADGYEYENQPWEKEAYRLEEEIFSKRFPWHLKFNQ